MDKEIIWKGICAFLYALNETSERLQLEKEEIKEKITVIDKSALTMTSLKIGNENLNFSYVNDNGNEFNSISVVKTTH